MHISPIHFLRHAGMSFAMIVGTSFTLSAIGHAASVTDKPSFPALSYWDNWTDAKGISHLTKCRITAFRPVKEAKTKSQSDKAPPQALVWTGANHTHNATVTTTVQSPGWKSTWQRAQRIEWITPVAGVYATQAMDGTRVELNPGDILLSEDIGSIRDKKGHQGHISSNEGDTASALMVTRFNTPTKPTHKACSQQ